MNDLFNLSLRCLLPAFLLAGTVFCCFLWRRNPKRLAAAATLLSALFLFLFAAIHVAALFSIVPAAEALIEEVNGWLAPIRPVPGNFTRQLALALLPVPAALLLAFATHRTACGRIHSFPAPTAAWLAAAALSSLYLPAPTTARFALIAAGVAVVWNLHTNRFLPRIASVAAVACCGLLPGISPGYPLYSYVELNQPCGESSGTFPPPATPECRKVVLLCYRDEPELILFCESLKRYLAEKRPDLQYELRIPSRSQIVPENQTQILYFLISRNRTCSPHLPHGTPAFRTFHETLPERLPLSQFIPCFAPLHQETLQVQQLDLSRGNAEGRQLDFPEIGSRLQAAAVIAFTPGDTARKLDTAARHLVYDFLSTRLPEPDPLIRFHVPDFLMPPPPEAAPGGFDFLNGALLLTDGPRGMEERRTVYALPVSGFQQREKERILSELKRKGFRSDAEYGDGYYRLFRGNAEVSFRIQQERDLNRIYGDQPCHLIRVVRFHEEFPPELLRRYLREEPRSFVNAGGLATLHRDELLQAFRELTQHCGLSPVELFRMYDTTMQNQTPELVPLQEQLHSEAARRIRALAGKPEFLSAYRQLLFRIDAGKCGDIPPAELLKVFDEFRQELELKPGKDGLFRAERTVAGLSRPLLLTVKLPQEAPSATWDYACSFLPGQDGTPQAEDRESSGMNSCGADLTIQRTYQWEGRYRPGWHYRNGGYGDFPPNEERLPEPGQLQLFLQLLPGQDQYRLIVRYRPAVP